MKKSLSLAQNSVFNTVGTIVYYLCQWAISMIVVRASTDQNVGLLQLAMTVTNIFIAFANYNMRPFQISDVHEEYASGHYVASRLLTCGISFFLCVGYSCLWGYSFQSILCIAIYLIYRFNESLSDVFHGIDQRHKRMDHVAVSHVVRGVSMVVIFWMILQWTDNLTLSIAFMAVVTLTFVLLYDVRIAGNYESVWPIFCWQDLRRLLLACLPSVISSICFTAVVTVPRQFLEESAGPELMGYYATVATPLVFVQVLMNGIISPVLSEISEAVAANNRPLYLRYVWKLLGVLTLVCGIAFAAVLFLGEPVMVFLYGEKIRPYVSLMSAVVGCTFLYAASAVGFNLLVVLRRMKLMMFLSVAALLVAVLSGKPLIDAAGADGVSFCIMLSYLFFSVASIISAMRSRVRSLVE